VSVASVKWNLISYVILKVHVFSPLYISTFLLFLTYIQTSDVARFFGVWSEWTQWSLRTEVWTSKTHNYLQNFLLFRPIKPKFLNLKYLFCTHFASPWTLTSGAVAPHPSFPPPPLRPCFRITVVINSRLTSESDVYWTVHHCDNWRIKTN